MPAATGKNPRGLRSSGTEHALKLVRAIRLCEKSGMRSDICEKIRRNVLESMEVLDPEIAEPREEHSSVAAPTAEFYELKLRQQVKFDAGWAKMKHFAWRYFECRPTSEVAAHVFELAFLHGNEADVSEALYALNRVDLGFYRFVNKAVRNQLLKLYWRCTTGKMLVGILARQRDERWLIPSERLFIFSNFHSDIDPRVGLGFFETNKKDILQAVKIVGAEVGLTRSAVELQAARHAVKLGKAKTASELLMKIPPSSREYTEGLSLSLSISIESKSVEKSEYARVLRRETSWKKRVDCLREFLETTRNAAEKNDVHRAVLNILLRSPLSIVPKTPAAWRLIIETLVCNTDIEYLLPELLQTLETNILIFHERTLDVALWQPCLDHGDKGLDSYWMGIAYLHRYVASQGKEEKSLWKARQIIIDTTESDTVVEDVPNPRLRAPGATSSPQMLGSMYSGSSTASISSRKKWDEIHRKTLEWMMKTPTISPESKDLVKVQLAVAALDSRISKSDLEAYMSKNPEAPPSVYGVLEKLALELGSSALLASLIRRKSSLTHMTNRDMCRLFKIHLDAKHYDVAWRICTIFSTRGVLSAGMSHAWEFSGEHRKIYPISRPNVDAIDASLANFSLDEAKLCRALLKVGPLLPELLAKSNNSIRSRKTRSAVRGSVEAEIEAKLNHISWLPARKKTYFFEDEAELSMTVRLPAFAKRLPNNQWSQILVKVIERLGVNTWKWRISILKESLGSQTSYRSSREDLRRFANRSDKTLKNTSATQRGGLADLRYLSRKMSDDAAAECMAKFVCRLTTMLYQNHVMAISSVQNMQAPLPILWDLETWIVGSQYGKYRTRSGTRNKVPIPGSLTSKSPIRRAKPGN